MTKGNPKNAIKWVVLLILLQDIVFEESLWQTNQVYSKMVRAGHATQLGLWPRHN